MLSARFSTADVDLDHLAEVVSARLLHCKITLSLFPYRFLWKEVAACRPHLRNGASRSTSLCFYVILWNSSAWELCLSFPIRLLSQQFIYIIMDFWAFIMCLGCTSALLCLFRCSVFQFWPLRAVSAGFFDCLTYSHHCVCACARARVCNTSLLSGTTKCSRFILYIPCSRPRIIHFSMEPWFL